MYDRRYEDRELNFEASGALQQASLVMRDRETDSWWSIMSSSAIGGELEGAGLEEMPLGEKTTWADWVARHPETKVLSVDGREHVLNNPYDNYFASDGTFRDLQIEDDRLAPKTPIYAFWLGGRPHAIAHSDFAGGALLDVPGAGRKLLLHREAGASLFASTRAWWVPGERVPPGGAAELVVILDGGSELPGLEPDTGFDTFWYNWVAVNPETVLIRP